MQAVRFYGERVELGHADKKVGRRGFLPAIHRREIRSDREFVRILRSAVTWKNGEEPLDRKREGGQRKKDVLPPHPLDTRQIEMIINRDNTLFDDLSSSRSGNHQDRFGADDEEYAPPSFFATKKSRPARFGYSTRMRSGTGRGRGRDHLSPSLSEWNRHSARRGKNLN